MVSADTFRQLALSFPGTTEEPHFDKTSFRYKKQIFATLSVEKKEAMLKFSVVDQSVFCLIDKRMIYPVSGTWGKQGCTIIILNKISKPLLREALTLSYDELVKKTAGKKSIPPRE